MMDLFCEKLFSLQPSIVKTLQRLNAYSDPSQTSRMDLFATIFAKGSILDV